MQADVTGPHAEDDKAPRFKVKLSFPLRMALLTLCVAVVCYFADWLGTTLILSWHTVSALWPGSAILVSVLLLVPRRMWPVLLPAGIGGFILRNVRVGLEPGVIALLQGADTIGILISALGLSYSFRGIPRLNNVKALGKYCFFTILLASFLSSFIGAAAVGDYWSNWAIWFLSHVLAFLTITPAILYWVSARPVWARTSLRKRLEATALTVTLILLGCIVFLVHWRAAPPALLYSFVPFLLWAALRFGATGVSSSMIIISFLAIWGAVHERGPFLGPDPLRSVLSLQLFLIFAATPFIFLAVLAEEREEAQEALSGVSRKLIEAHEQERTFIARELHDDVCQRLAILSLRAEKASKGWRNKQVPVDDQLEEIRQQSSALASDVQALSHQLHPSILDNLGLVAAVKSFCRDISEHNYVVVDFSDITIPNALPRDVSLALFRVIQEALHNSVKHSGGKRFEVHLQGEGGGIELEVSDRGVGFDASDRQNNRGLGLVNMAERIHQVNGTFSVDSRVNAGTRIRVHVPLATS
jgi:signal transduction histidine kinase